MPLTDPAIRAEKRRWPHKQIKDCTRRRQLRVRDYASLLCLFGVTADRSFGECDVRAGVLSCDFAKNADDSNLEMSCD